MPRPSCSILIANYNGEHLLADCIDSVLGQRGDFQVEIIIHDDCSTDRSLDLLRTHYPQARIIESAENVGFCIANNRMAAIAEGEYLLLLNNDAALFPDALSALFDPANDVAGISTLPQFAWDDGRIINYGCRLDLFYNAVPAMRPGKHALAMVEGACLFLPRRLWTELGGFPEWFGSIAEDAMLCCAARLAGTAVRCLESSGYRHRQGASFSGLRANDGRLRTRFRRRYLSERNRIALLATCTPTWLAWLLLGLHWAILLAEAIGLCALQGTMRPWHEIYFPAMRDAWSLREKTLALRRGTQARRCIGLREYLRGFVFFPYRLRLLVRHGAPRITD